MSRFPHLFTERLELAPIAKEENEETWLIFTEPFVRKYLWDDTIISLETVGDILRENRHCFEERNWGLWWILEREKGIKLGFAGLWIFFAEDQPQLIYGLLPQYWGKGFASEAAHQLCTYAAQDLGFLYLTASCDLANTASQRVALQIGMEKYKEEVIDGKPTCFFKIAFGEKR